MAINFSIATRMLLSFLACTAANATSNPSYPIATQISVGGFACATLASGKVSCWGRTNPISRRIVHKTHVIQAEPLQANEPPQDLTGVNQVTVGLFHACALVSGSDRRGVYCWGENESGQLGVGDKIRRKLAARVPGILGNEVIEIVAGDQNTCARMKNGMIYCWGGGAIGVHLNESLTPTAVTLPGPSTFLASGSQHACAIIQSGDIYCWGKNLSGQLGDGTTTSSLTPVRVKNEDTLMSGGAIQLAAGFDHTCAVYTSTKVTGTAFCWGNGSSGQLGAVLKESPKPVKVPAENVLAVKAGRRFTCASLSIKGRGQLHCWGENSYGQLGNGTRTWNSAPTATELLVENSIPPTATLERFSTGHDFACAIGTDSILRCWGTNEFWNLANPSMGLSFPSPVAVAPGLKPLEGVTDFSLGQDFGCAVTKKKQVLCWGKNSEGALGSGTAGFSTIPRTVQTRNPESFAFSPLNDVTSVKAGRSHACAISGPAGSILCWGVNSGGQLGDGTPTSRSFAASVLRADNGQPLEAAVAVYSGEDSSCALIGQDKNLFCWGSLHRTANRIIENRALQIRDAMDKGKPLLGIEEAQPGNTTCFRKFGKILCFGRNEEGQLGNGTFLPAKSEWDTPETPEFNREIFGFFPNPFYVMTDFRWAPWTGSKHLTHWWHRALDESLPNKTPWAFTADAKLTQISRLSTGPGSHRCAVSTGGKVYCWGLTPAQNTGQGGHELPKSQTPESLRVAQEVRVCKGLPSAQGCDGETAPLFGMKEVSTGDRFTCAYGTGSLYCWGSNLAAQSSEAPAATLSFAFPSSALKAAQITDVIQLESGGESVCVRTKKGRIACWGKTLGNDSVLSNQVHRASFVVGD